MSMLAYLDPGSGSVLLQALLGGVAALAITGKLWWHRLLTLLRIRKPETRDAPRSPSRRRRARPAPSLLGAAAEWRRRPQPSPARFRDPDSRVFARRRRDPSRAERARPRRLGGLSATRVLRPMQRERQDRRHRAAGGAARAASTSQPRSAALRHERVPFVSYPYEWPFSMLRDAALLQLELLRAALAEDMVLKDASPYNVQWRGSRPVFIDVGSFERARRGRAVGRLPPVLLPLPLPADDPGVRRAAVPALASRLARGHRAGAGARDPPRAPPVPPRRPHPRRSARSPRAPRGRSRHP